MNTRGGVYYCRLCHCSL